MTASRSPSLDNERLNGALAELAARARPGVLGVGLMNLDGGQSYTFNGERRFPMQSVFKLPLGAAVLAAVETGRLRLTDPLVVKEEQLSPQHSPIALSWPNRSDYSVDELLVAAVVDSDNTAADVLMRQVGGPGAVTAWLQSKRAFEIRVDRYERELQTDVYGLPSFRPEWRTEAGWAAAKAQVTPARRQAAMRAYMADPRDTATPRGMLEFLRMLNGGELLSPASTRRLLQMMVATARGNDRLRAGLPTSAVFAHRPGTGGTDQGLNVAFNDVGIFTLPDRRSYAVAGFLTGSTSTAEARAQLFADLGRVVALEAG
jgi:beta-lactamase class A